MFADANCSSKRDADSYAYEYAQCYTNGYGHADSDDYAHGYCNCDSHCNSYSYRYGHSHCQANADSAPAHDTEAASYASAATVAVIRLLNHSRVD